MLNETNLTVTVYAEVRNSDFELIQEANAILEPTKLNSYTPIDFHFKLNHLPIGRYYLVIRPVDISATDLTINTIVDSWALLATDRGQGTVSCINIL